MCKKIGMTCHRREQKREILQRKRDYCSRVKIVLSKPSNEPREWDLSSSLNQIMPSDKASFRLSFQVKI